MSIIATPSRAIPSRALANRARPSGATRIRPAYVWRFAADLIDRVRHVEASFGRVGPAGCDRNGKYIHSPEDVPSFDGLGVRVRSECDYYLWGTDHPELFEKANAISNDLSPDAAPDGGNAGRVAFDLESLWQVGRLRTGMTLAVGEQWGAYVMIKARNAEDVGKCVRLGIQEHDGSTGELTESADVVLTNDWQEVFVSMTITMATANRIRFLLLRGAASATKASGCDFCFPQVYPGDLKKDFMHNLGQAGSVVTRTTEAADETGNGLRVPLPDDIKAALGVLVVDAKGNVLTPTGPELIDPDTVWTGSAWTHNTHDSGSCLSAPSAYTQTYVAGLLTAGHSYIVKFTVTEVSGNAQCRTGAAGADTYIITETGDHIFILTAAEGLADLQFRLVDEGGSLAYHSLKVAEINPAATIYLKWRPGRHPAGGLGAQGLLNLDSASSNLGLFYNNDGRVQAGDGSQQPLSGVDYVKGEEALAAMIFDGGNFRVYINGVIGADKAYSVVNAQSWDGLYGHAGNTDYDDTFVEIGLANYAMSAEELANV